LLTFAPSLLLRVLLEYTETPEKYPKNVAWLWVVLLFVTGVANSLASSRALFIGRRICIRLRAIIIGEIYAKALRRKAAAAEIALGDEEETKDATEDKKKVDKKKLPDDEEAAPAKKNSEPETDKKDGQVNVGAIINLM
jgi:hypothetical protein